MAQFKVLFLTTDAFKSMARLRRHSWSSSDSDDVKDAHDALGWRSGGGWRGIGSGGWRLGFLGTASLSDEDEDEQSDDQLHVVLDMSELFELAGAMRSGVI